jgi:hypothetical protein
MSLDHVPTEDLQEELSRRLCNHHPELNISLRDVPRERVPLITCKCGKRTWASTGVEFGQLGLPIKLQVEHAALGGIRILATTKDGVLYREYGIPRKGHIEIDDLHVKIGVELPDSTRLWS